jgi:hypothetical protein
MTALHITWLASIAGALLFFTAGLATMALRRSGRDASARAATRELAMMREQLASAHHDIAAWRARADAATKEAATWRTHADALESRVRTEVRTDAGTDVATDIRTHVRTPASDAMATLRARVVRAESEAREATTGRARAEVAARDAIADRDRAEQVAREATAARERAEAIARSATAARDVEAALAAAQAAHDASLCSERDAAAAALGKLRRDLEQARADAAAARDELDAASARARELDEALAARTDSLRDLATEHEQLKGRLRDADALRAEYVRLKTNETEREFLKAEVARLEQELATTRAAALGAVAARPPRSARGTTRPGTRPTGSIGESLASVLDRFADTGTRSIAIGDPQGFVLASSGDDGLGLAAHAAQLAETAARATQLLPVGAPAAIEVIDDHGARLSVWTFTVDGDRLLLASLSVSPPEPKRVEATLADLAAVLEPTALARGSYR